MILDYLADHSSAKAAAIAEHVSLKPSRVRDYLRELIAEGRITAAGANKNRVYSLAPAKHR